MKFFILFLVMFAAGAFISIPQQASAQTFYTNQQVAFLLRRVENHSGSFHRVVYGASGNVIAEPGKTTFEQRYVDERMKDRVRDYEGALKRFRRQFDHATRWIDAKPYLLPVIIAGRDINTYIRKHKFSSEMTSSWSLLRNDISMVARLYNLPGVI